MHRHHLRTLAFVISVAAALLFVQGYSVATAASPSSSSDFNYRTNVAWVQASPDTVLPLDVPLCHTGNPTVPGHPTIVCYSPNFVQKAYDFKSLYDAGHDGRGQTIVIVDAYGSPTIASDLKHFDSVFGLPDPNFKVVCPLGCPGFTPNNFFLGEEGWTIETTLDVEWSHAMAPGASIVLAVAPSPAGNAINSVEAFVVAHYPGAIMSQSFGIPESALVANNAQIVQAHLNYVAAAAKGMTVLASAGDSGATNGGSLANALFPSSDPLVTSIGGTQGNGLVSTNATRTAYPFGLADFTGTCTMGPRPGFPTGCTPTGYGSEAVWNEPWLPAAGGGAPSLIFKAPSFQSGDGISTSVSHGMRTTPDVSYNGAVDGGVLVFWSAEGTPIWFIVGGTSAGSPQWASLFAIANQIRAGEKGPLGFVNPTLYGLTASQKASDFHDITAGNNQQKGTPVGFTATTGYDLGSGWGTPDAANLVGDLANA